MQPHPMYKHQIDELFDELSQEPDLQKRELLKSKIFILQRQRPVKQ